MMNNLYPLAPESKIITERRLKALKQRETKSMIFSIVRMLLGLTILIIIFLFLFGFRIIDGNGMYPALSDGDLVLTYNKSSYIKNDIVFYKVEDKEYCGRVVAKAGDKIGFKDDKFYVNGTAQTTDIIFPTSAPQGFTETQTVPDNTVCILGDYRTQCEDSRVFGYIPLNDVKAKVIALLRHKTL